MTPTADPRATLRAEAERLGQSLPALLAEAEMLAQTVMLGEHGRKRAGQGDEFWQYRAAHAGDSARAIDWRRSARADTPFVREREWQAAQSVTLWVDPSRSMTFTGDSSRPSKATRARVLALALGILMLKGGERVGLAGQAPRPGRAQVMGLANGLSDSAEDYGLPDATGLVPQGRAVFLSDFLGPLDGLETALAFAADRGVRGVLIHLLDPTEEEFPFTGRTIFDSMGATISHETQSAAALRDRYLARLADRKERLATLARAVGWQYACHHTGHPAQTALLWAYQALEGGR